MAWSSRATTPTGGDSKMIAPWSSLELRAPICAPSRRPTCGPTFRAGFSGRSRAEPKKRRQHAVLARRLPKAQTTSSEAHGRPLDWTSMKPETRSFYELAVQKAVERVVTGLDGALDLQALARTAALSPFHFHRIFRGMVGETPLELHRRLRLERSAWPLLNADLPVTTVAFGAGYETHESFTRAFRLHYDCSPSEFRQSRDLSAPTCMKPFRTGLAARSGIHFESERSQPVTLHLTRGEPV